MPNVSFYLKKSYSERMEDLLLAANEGRASDQQLKDISEWERSQLRGYLSGFINVYRRWESDGKIIDPRTTSEVEASDLKFKADSVRLDQEVDKDRPFKRILILGEKQTEWIKKALSFYKAYEEYLNKKFPKLPALRPSLETRSRTVGDLVQGIIDLAAWQLLASLDQKELDAEEKQLKEGNVGTFDRERQANKPKEPIKALPRKY